jgi:hypothetical protein
MSILEQALERLDYCKSYYYNLAIEKSDLKVFLEIPFNDLPKYMCSSELIKDVVFARLDKQDIKKNAELILRHLYDVAFDCEDYKDIGWHDGQLECLAMIFKESGDTEHEQEARSWMYSQD